MLFEYYDGPQAGTREVDQYCQFASAFWASHAESKTSNLIIIPSIVYDVLRKTCDDMNGYTSANNSHQKIIIPDHFKEAAHVAFWSRRLRPLVFQPSDPSDSGVINNWLNESFSLRFASYLCTEGEKFHGREPRTMGIPQELDHDLKIMMRYKHLSPHALMIILRSVFYKD